MLSSVGASNVNLTIKIKHVMLQGRGHVRDFCAPDDGACVRSFAPKHPVAPFSARIESQWLYSFEEAIKGGWPACAHSLDHFY